MSKKTGALKHAHQYYQAIVGYGPRKKNPHPTKVWKCGLRGCTHNIPTHMNPPVGCPSYCWSCGEPLTLEDWHMLIDYPVHATCPAFDYKSEIGFDDDLPVYK